MSYNLNEMKNFRSFKIWCQGQTFKGVDMGMFATVTHHFLFHQHCLSLEIEKTRFQSFKFSHSWYRIRDCRQASLVSGKKASSEWQHMLLQSLYIMFSVQIFSIMHWGTIFWDCKDFFTYAVSREEFNIMSSLHLDSSHLRCAFKFFSIT